MHDGLTGGLPQVKHESSRLILQRIRGFRRGRDSHQRYSNSETFRVIGKWSPSSNKLSSGTTSCLALTLDLMSPETDTKGRFHSRGPRLWVFHGWSRQLTMGTRWSTVCSMTVVLLTMVSPIKLQTGVQWVEEKKGRVDTTGIYLYSSRISSIFWPYTTLSTTYFFSRRWRCNSWTSSHSGNRYEGRSLNGGDSSGS